MGLFGASGHKKGRATTETHALDSRCQGSRDARFASGAVSKQVLTCRAVMHLRIAVNEIPVDEVSPEVCVCLAAYYHTCQRRHPFAKVAAANGWSLRSHLPPCVSNMEDVPSVSTFCPIVVVL